MDKNKPDNNPRTISHVLSIMTASIVPAFAKFPLRDLDYGGFMGLENDVVGNLLAMAASIISGAISYYILAIWLKIDERVF